MEHAHDSAIVKPVRVPWNKGKLVGAKPPLRPSHVWSIRTNLQIEGKKRDLAAVPCVCDRGGRRPQCARQRPMAARRHGQEPPLRLGSCRSSNTLVALFAGALERSLR